MSTRWVCIHGHFYQPPRENPWLEAIERQDSAHPHHDWNRRITSECYAPNATARILDGSDRIQDIVNNYARISFNFGPTLLAWMEEAAPEVYGAILQADVDSARRFGGHGSAMAQVYNHLIMPLASTRDKRTQVRWGIADFEHRFGRRPEGMWLAETAVDLESLDVMAAEGIRYTVLAPHQVESVRAPDRAEWRPAAGSGHTNRALRIALPSGRDIAVFCYDGGISRAVAFERLLTDGAAFAGRLVRAVRDRPAEESPLVHIATDGETYGHHHRHGEMALAFALRDIEGRDDVDLTNYGEYLERHPPVWEARLREDTSWSCSHGVERWRSDCGCHGARHAHWHQRWRGPLRDALEALRDEVAPRYEWKAGSLFADPWEARDAYAQVIVDRSDESLARFFAAASGRPLDESERTRALKLLELQRHALLMYTSCGWFFNEVSDLETVQVLAYAARVLDLARDLFDDGAELEAAFLDRLEEAESNLPEIGTARTVYLREVGPARVDLRKAGAHYAVSSVFDTYPERAPIYCFQFERLTEGRFHAAAATLLVGRVRVTNMVTREGEELGYAVLHIGNHNVTGGVRPRPGIEANARLERELSGPFLRTDFTTVIRLLDREFDAATYSLKSLFRDAQRRIVDRVLEAAIEDTERVFARVYEDRSPLMRFLADLDVPRPRPWVVAAEYVLNLRLRRIFETGQPQLAVVRAVLEDSDAAGVDLDEQTVAFSAESAIERMLLRASEDPGDPTRLDAVRELVDLLEDSTLQVDLWRAQNVFHRMVRTLGPEMRGRAGNGDPRAEAWMRAEEALGNTLRVVVPWAEAGAETEKVEA